MNKISHRIRKVFFFLIVCARRPYLVLDLHVETRLVFFICHISLIPIQLMDLIIILLTRLLIKKNTDIEIDFFTS